MLAQHYLIRKNIRELDFCSGESSGFKIIPRNVTPSMCSYEPVIGSNLLSIGVHVLKSVVASRLISASASEIIPM